MEAALCAALLALAAQAAGASPSADCAPLPAAAWAIPEGPPSLADLLRQAPRTTSTKDGVPGDPLNIALVGTRTEVVAALCAAGWYPADPITLRSAVGISVSVALNVPYPQAPVSNLYLWCRPQDLAFEQPCGKSARSRHHVRFWCSGIGPDGRPVWLGAATFDASVGRSARTGRVTHHIAADVDRERDKLVADLQRAGALAEASLAPWTGPRQALNGEGDPYFTDGNLAVGVLFPRSWAAGCFAAPAGAP